MINTAFSMSGKEYLYVDIGQIKNKPKVKSIVAKITNPVISRR